MSYANPTAATDSHEIVENLHAEIELLMLSGGYSREVAVRMLLNKAAKEKERAAQRGVAGMDVVSSCFYS